MKIIAMILHKSKPTNTITEIFEIKDSLGKRVFKHTSSSMTRSCIFFTRSSWTGLVAPPCLQDLQRSQQEGGPTKSKKLW